MTNYELYINAALCDLSSDFTIRLNRLFVSPSELNTKDAQFSYSIQLPFTPTNHAAMRNAHIEEMGGKFNRIYVAELYARSVPVFKGLFRLTEVSTAYKGNLYVPVAKTASDLFGDTVLNELPEWRIPFADFAASVNAYNASPNAVIFPAVLYGLLPKVPLTTDASNYSDKTVWDDTVRLGMTDIPPSLNLIQLIQHIFSSKGLALTGTALTDDRLLTIFMSYKNATDYVQPWNYGAHASLHISGAWDSRVNKRTSSDQFERGVNQSQDDLLGQVYSTDLLDSTNASLTIIDDPGGNVLLSEVADADGTINWSRGQIKIPVSGYYKIRLRCNYHVLENNNWRDTDPATGVQQVSGMTENAHNAFNENIYSLKLLRDRKSGDFGVSSSKIDGCFYYGNQPQNDTFDADNVPKYFPPVGSVNQESLNFVDAAQNDKILAGFQFGHDGDNGEDSQHTNPLDKSGAYTQILCAKPSLSWDASATPTSGPSRIGINSPGYMKYGKIGTFDSEGDNPNVKVNYAFADRLTGDELDANGNPIGVTGQPTTIMQRFAVARWFAYNFVCPTGSGIYGKVFVFDSPTDTTPISVVDISGDNFTVNTSIDGATPVVYLTMYLKNTGFDVDGTMTIERVIDTDTANIISWEQSLKLQQTIMNYPGYWAKRGLYAGSSLDPNWYASGEVNLIAWLDAGELLTVADVSSEGRYRRDGMHSTFGWVNHSCDFDLLIEPFQANADWLKVDLVGRGTAPMNWDDTPTFDTDSIDLVRFLSADTKVDDWLTNVCKAFNLKLSDLGNNAFSLDVKQSGDLYMHGGLDLSTKASVKDRVNQPLGLPAKYVIGFTIDESEEGYTRTQDAGGGTYETGTDGDTIEQKSSFSYNWYKPILKGSDTLQLPIISDADVWEASIGYSEGMAKRFTDKAYRFWYVDGILPGTFDFNGQPLYLSAVKEVLPGRCMLNYHNAAYSLMRNFFTLLIRSSSQYTIVEAYLLPDEYNGINASSICRFNGDVYRYGELSGYDPAGKNKTTIKLIRLL